MILILIRLLIMILILIQLLIMIPIIELLMPPTTTTCANPSGKTCVAVIQLPTQTYKDVMMKTYGTQD